MFNGRCRYGQNERDWIGGAATSNVFTCYYKCKVTDGCVAFAYDATGGANCDFYRGGPYDYGNGANANCYTIVPGIFIV